MEKENLEFLNSQSNIHFSDVKVDICSKIIECSENVVKEIKDFVPADGWISLQSTPAKRIQGTDFDAKGEHVLSGDFCNSNGVSLSVRFDGEKWNFFFCHESDAGEPVLKKSIRQLSKISDKIYLNYNVYYKFDPDLGHRTYCSAFTGFTEE